MGQAYCGWVYLEGLPNCGLTQRMGFRWLAGGKQMGIGGDIAQRGIHCVTVEATTINYLNNNTNDWVKCTWTDDVNLLLLLLGE